MKKNEYIMDVDRIKKRKGCQISICNTDLDSELNELNKIKATLKIKNLENFMVLCEVNSISDNQINTDEIPEITDFSDFKYLHPEYFKDKKN